MQGIPELGELEELQSVEEALILFPELAETPPSFRDLFDRGESGFTVLLGVVDDIYKFEFDWTLGIDQEGKLWFMIYEATTLGAVPDDLRTAFLWRRDRRTWEVKYDCER
jgi:hypothetical protein